MSQLDKMYNWNGNYKIKRELVERRYKVSELKYPEYLHIFLNEDNTIRYSIIDEHFGYPALANTHEGKHSIELRAKVVEVLDSLEKEGYIEKIN